MKKIYLYEYDPEQDKFIRKDCEAKRPTAEEVNELISEAYNIMKERLELEDKTDAFYKKLDTFSEKYDDSYAEKIFDIAFEKVMNEKEKKCNCKNCTCKK
jgi:hypothetical protein